MTATLVVDAPLAHLRWGDAGAPVLLLHGVGGGRQAWAATGPALAAASRVAVAVDLPGYGLTPMIEPYDLAGLAAAVERLIDWLGRGPVVLVGHSMGGMVAQELAARSPRRLAALVLASTSPAFGPTDGHWQRSFLHSRCAPLDAGLGMAGLAAQLVPGMVAADATDECIAGAQALMAGVPEATYRSALAALTGFDRRAALEGIGVPTLVVTGEHDRSAAPEVARRMAGRIAGAHLDIVAGAGHLLPLEKPLAFNQALLDFLSPH